MAKQAIKSGDLTRISKQIKRKLDMTGNDFGKVATKIVMEYAQKHLDKDDDTVIDEDEVFIIYLGKILNHNKALLGTTLYNGVLYEATFNSDKSEIYLDVYQKIDNVAIDVVDDQIVKPFV